MSLSSRVAWTEGLFLRPQHFQQESRFNDRVARTAWACFAQDGWGFDKLDLNLDILDLGKIAIASGRGLLPDGEVFDFPEHDLPPSSVDVAEDDHGKTIYFCIQPRRFGDRETSLAGRDTRRKTEAMKIMDTATEDQTEPAAVEIARLATSLKIEPKADRGIEGFITIPIARIADIAADGAVKLEQGFIPTVMGYGQSPILKSFVTTTQGLLEGRSETLAARVTGASSGGAPEVADYILLQTVNRYLNIFRVMAAAPRMHPFELYKTATNLCAEFATYTQPKRRAIVFPDYAHKNLTETFRPVIDEVRRCLSYIGDPTATALSLQDRGFGIQVCEVSDRSILTSAQIVIAVGASMSGEDLRKAFPSQVKIGNVDIIRDLVNVQIPGVRVKALPQVPRQIPYHAGKVYFELERKGEYWQGLQDSGNIAIHVGGRFPDLDVKLWAIRETKR